MGPPKINPKVMSGEFVWLPGTVKILRFEWGKSREVPGCCGLLCKKVPSSSCSPSFTSRCGVQGSQFPSNMLSHDQPEEGHCEVICFCLKQPRVQDLGRAQHIMQLKAIVSGRPSLGAVFHHARKQSISLYRVFSLLNVFLV